MMSIALSPLGGAGEFRTGPGACAVGIGAGVVLRSTKVGVVTATGGGTAVSINPGMDGVAVGRREGKALW